MYLVNCKNCGKNTYFMSELTDSENCFYCGWEFDRNKLIINKHHFDYSVNYSCAHGRCFVERRKSPRCKYFTKAQYSIRGRPDLGNWVVQTENISREGLLIAGSAELPVGGVTIISFMFPDITSSKIILYGETVRISYNEKYWNRKYVGIKISKNGFAEQINNYVIENNKNKHP